MRRIRCAFLSLCADRRGSVAWLMAAAIVPLVAAIGLSVDGARGWLVKSRLSQAIDAAGLAGGRVITSATRDDEIRMFFQENFPNGFMKANVYGPHIAVDGDKTTITIDASATLPTTFMRVVGVNQLTVRANTVVKRTDRGMELVLVMDNTGSMSTNDRIGKMKSAATDLVNFLYGSRETVPNFWVGLVPYVSVVNVGTGNSGWTVANTPASFNVTSMTRSTVTFSDNNEPSTAVVCVDVDPATPITNLLRSGYLVDIAGASDAKYNGRFMIRAGAGATAVPVASGFGLQSPGCPITAANAATRFWYQISPTTNWYSLTPVLAMPATPAARAVAAVPITAKRPAPVYTDGSSWKGCVEARGTPYEENQAEVKPADQPWVRSYWPSTNKVKFYEYPKYKVLRVSGSTRSRAGDNDWSLPRHPDDTTGAVVETVAAGNEAHGPNLGCGPALTPLQPNKSTVTTAISQMGPWSRGGTMANIGLAWAWRVLSPDWRGMWTASPNNLPLDYNTPEHPSLIDKVVILLTDGTNEWYDYPDHPPGCAQNMNPCTLPGDADYTAYGRLVDQRLGSGINTNTAARTEINNRMTALCTAMKNKGIIIYTIVVETPDQAINDLYSGCASKPAYYFPTPDSNQLSTVFHTIAEQLANLRLAQ
jgi:Flp pilus assembly protein TadG